MSDLIAHSVDKEYSRRISVGSGERDWQVGPESVYWTTSIRGNSMSRWVPFGLVSLIWLGLMIKNWQQRRYRRVVWWLGCWGLSALTWTPLAFSFGGSDLAGITTSWWSGGVWVLTPLQPASIDASFWLNVLMTMPQGALLLLNWPRLRWPQWLLAGLGTGLALEGGQAIGNALVSLGRWVDINDVITNCAGVFFGAWLVAVIRRRWLKNGD